jgi:hypothetical protein
MNAVGWSCTRKIPYATRGEAKRAKRIMASKKREVFSIYRCPYCLEWHIAHRREEDRG